MCSFMGALKCDVFQIRFREVAPKLVQLLTEWTETFPYDFRDERMMRCLKDMTHHVARGDEVSIPGPSNKLSQMVF